ncbi:protein mahjong isoform X2 [Toxorhynchites rutilus septentrionalis]|uniref:protein mahjong isoform X2 n=1 Tax=Toxorhynchites rutilus septentrionalis TaxID=329112 RepID=UPI00247B01B2|nr:protein mahjong isoform X2 [Toxorhynchites rutilus septentrionalis]
MASPPDQVEILRGRDLTRIFQLWEERHSTSGYDPEPIVTRLAEIFEEETEVYMRKDPDPFDERHPSRTDPNSELGRMLKTLFRKDHFMTRLVNDYLRDNFFTRQNVQQCSQPLNIAACRLILVIMPGLETSAVFQAEFDHLINRLYGWAESSPEPLQSYATGLLGAAMEVQEIAVSFREQNIRLLPIMLRRLHVLQLAHRNRDRLLEAGEGTSSTAFQRMFQGESTSISQQSSPVKTRDEAPMEDEENSADAERPFAHLGATETVTAPSNGASPESNLNLLFQNENSQNTQDNGQGRTSHRNMIPIFPATIATSQMLILRYLTPMGEYQEFLPHVFEHNAMSLIFRYIENLEAKDTCLAFEALKYLASLLCHKKFSLEFIANGGLERLLKVPRPSLAATGVSIAFYYLAYCEDAMERICLMPQKIITELVTYALWLLGCSHDSGRCHATMFFGLSCQFKTMMDEFDKQDGLRKMYNVISVLPILLPADDYNLNDDEECAARQVVRHVCVALKKYFENHLYYKYSQVTRQQCPTGTLAQPVFKSVKNSPEVISDQIKTLQELLPMKARWSPVDEFLDLGGVNLLLRIIALAYEWNYSGRAETVRAALDVLNICCVIPRVHAMFCERIDFPDEGSAAGINIVLGAAEGEIVADAEVQKSALAVLVHTVCAPIHRPSGSLARFGSAKKRMPNKNSEELLQKVWESVRSNNGIIVLLSLMCVKTPITDADCIRGMACRALAGLARSETVQQIIGKLPLFVNGQLQSLMRDPILQEKRAEHVQFQKYALELMERVSGKAKTFNNQLDTSLADIHKANVVAQTKIQFNEQQLYQLIYQHLMARGLSETATNLVKESGISVPISHQQHHQHQQVSSISRNLHHSPFAFRSPSATIIQRSRIRSKASEPSFNHSMAQANLQAALAAASIEASSLAAGSTNSDLQAIKMDTPIGAGATLASDATTEPFTPIKLIKKTNTSSASAGGAAGSSSSHGNSININTPFSSSSSNQRSLQKQISATVDTASFLVPASTSSKTTTTDGPSSTVTLDTIITEYLTNQHALCKHPMSTCPQFDLFVPHKCPDPRPNRASGMSTNFAARFFKRHAGYSSERFDRRLVHSNFSASRVLRPQDSEFFFTCCYFTPCATKLITGSHSGEVKIFNLSDSNEEYNYSCHESYVNSIKCSKDGQLLLTSCAWRSPMTALWNIENNRFSQKLQWDEEEYMEFPNIKQDKVLATTGEVATIYDINTGQKTLSLVPNIYNQYTKNRATFCPSDELVLSDGVLWDVTSGKEIHKFDKLNQTISGVFHPNGLEIVSNTEVWDLRTFHLLRTVPALDQCYVSFSPQNVIYGICPEVETEPNSDNVFFESSFKVLDGYNYSSISTVDVKRNIYDLAINLYGSQIAIVENQGGFNSVQESVVRIYSVGRKKNTEDDAEEEEEEMENSEDNSMSETESVVFHGARGENGGQRRRRRRGMRINVLDDDDIFQPGSSSSSEDDDDDDDMDDNDDDGDNGENDDNEDNDGGEDDGANNNEDDGEEDASSWTTTSDLEDFLLL